MATNARRINGFISKRAIILLFACIILALGLTGRLFYLQVLRYDYYESIVLNNVSATTTVSASRGVITETVFSSQATIRYTAHLSHRER